jgi:hypothetical protein
LGIKGTDRVIEYATNRVQSLARAKQLTDSIWKEIDVANKTGTNPFDQNSIIGTYKDAWLGEVMITVKNGKLWFDSRRSPKLTGELFYYKGTTYVVRWKDRSMDADAFVNFSLDETGNGAGITMKPISPLTDFSYDFQDLDFHRSN